MNALQYILAGWWHHRRAHAGVVLGTMIGAGVLMGALWVGEAVRQGLKSISEARLGRTQSVLVTGERFFQADLAAALSLGEEEHTAAVLMLPGTGIAQEKGLRAGEVQVVGVDAGFWWMGQREGIHTSRGHVPSLQADEALVNIALANQLGLKVGDRLLVRVDDPGPMAREAPLATPGQAGLALPVTVKGILSRSEFGQFGLAANQASPLSVFVDRSWLAEKLDQQGGANVLLTTANELAFREALQNNWRLRDLQLVLRTIPGAGDIELRSSRVFLDESITAAASQVGDAPIGVLTYLVNELSHGARSTPYSMVTAWGPMQAPMAPSAPSQPAPPALSKTEKETDTAAQVSIHPWLAEDLHAGIGDEISMSFFVMGEGRKLLEQQVKVRVDQVGEDSDPRWDATLMPAFPGLAEQENCRDWDPGFAMDLAKIRPKDEEYWNKFKGTPKAWVTLADGQSWWSNRFGNLTAVRWHTDTHTASAIEQSLRAQLDPMKLGWEVMDVRAMAALAGGQALDFGALLAGCSMFLVLASAVLTALLMSLAVQNRREEIGTLLGLGFTQGRIRRWLMVEGLLPAIVGTALGAGLGAGYAQFLLWGLQGIWRGAMGGAEMGVGPGAGASPGPGAGEPMWTLSLDMKSLWIGGAINLMAALPAMYFALRSLRHEQARELLSGQASERVWPTAVAKRKWKAALVPSVVAGAAALMVLASGWNSALATNQQVGIFFGAGALSLAAMLLGVRAGLWWLVSWSADTTGTLMMTGIRALGRERGRHLAAVAILASGLFLVVAVQAQRPQGLRDFQNPASGSGGFALWAQAGLPMAHHPQTDAASPIMGLDPALSQGITLLPWRMKAGDETSCLNLHAPVNPRIFGIDARSLAQRGSFTFTSYHPATWEKYQANQKPQPAVKPHPHSPWWWLVEQYPTELDDAPAEVGGIVDAGTLQWALRKRVGDVVEVTDGRGQKLSIRIVAAVERSILQGGIVIDEQAFIRHFPLDTGYRGMLVTLPPQASAQQVTEVQLAMSRAYEDVGLEVVTTMQRLARFNQVETTYLAMFEVLGGLGLMLGSAGVGVLVLRHVNERRAELATLRALGFTRRQVMHVVMTEHAGIVLLGVACGTMAALPALQPMVAGASLPWGRLLLLLVFIGGTGLLWTFLASWWALRGDILSTLAED